MKHFLRCEGKIKLQLQKRPIEQKTNPKPVHLLEPVLTGLQKQRKERQLEKLEKLSGYSLFSGFSKSEKENEKVENSL